MDEPPTSNSCDGTSRISSSYRYLRKYALALGCREGDHSMAELLLQRGSTAPVCIDSTNWIGKTPLGWAAQKWAQSHGKNPHQVAVGTTTLHLGNLHLLQIEKLQEPPSLFTDVQR